MTNNDYVMFFNECLNHNMTIKKYIPVQDKIFKIIDFYGMKFAYRNTSYQNKMHFAKGLLKTFNKILKENKYEDLDEYIDFLIFIEIYPSYFDDLLNVMVFKDKCPNKNFDNYYTWYLFKIFDFAEEKIDMLDSFYGQSRIVNMIRIYFRYYENPYDDSIPDYIATKRSDFESVALGVIADIYDTDLDLSILDTFFNDLVNDYENTMTFLSLNGLLRDYDSTYGIEYAYETLKQYDKQKRIIR